MQQRTWIEAKVNSIDSSEEKVACSLFEAHRFFVCIMSITAKATKPPTIKAIMAGPTMSIVGLAVFCEFSSWLGVSVGFCVGAIVGAVLSVETTGDGKGILVSGIA